MEVVDRASLPHTQMHTDAHKNAVVDATIPNVCDSKSAQ